MTTYIADHTIFEIVDITPPPPHNIPVPVVPPKCWEVVQGDGQIPAVQLMDEYPRETILGETNMTFPHRPYEDGRVSTNGKHNINLQGTTWLEWQRDILGDRNFEQKGAPGDGFEDTNDGTIPVFVNGEINPDKPRKQMCAGTGGGKYNIIDTVIQGGNKYDVIETMNFYSQPVKLGDTWFYNETPMTWETHPHLFTSRVNSKKVKQENQTWLSKRGVHAVSDGGIVGNKMKEWWPNPSKVPVTQPRYMLRHYPTLPAQLHLYANSVIVDGELIPQTGGVEIEATKYRFYGSKVFVFDNLSGNWYLADEMLIRASLETGWYATALDYRCYVVERGSDTPWMGDRGYGVPDPGIFRKDMGLMFYVRYLLGDIRNLRSRLGAIYRSLRYRKE